MQDETQSVVCAEIQSTARKRAMRLVLIPLAVHAVASWAVMSLARSSEQVSILATYWIVAAAGQWFYQLCLVCTKIRDELPLVNLLLGILLPWLFWGIATRQLHEVIPKTMFQGWTIESAGFCAVLLAALSTTSFFAIKFLIAKFSLRPLA